MNDKRTKKSANYAVEKLICCSGETLGNMEWTMNLWGQIKDGFISPSEALDFVKGEKIQGAFRVVRIASELFNGGLITPEPIYSFVKASNAKVVRKPRKTREPKTLKVNVDPELTNAPDETEPFPIDENLTPVPDALGKSDAK